MKKSILSNPPTYFARKQWLACILLLLPAFTFYYFWTKTFHTPNGLKQYPALSEKESAEPNDWFFAQRAYPFGVVPSDTYYAALKWTKEQAQARGEGLDWSLAGPTNFGGRVTDIAMHASDLQTIYVATASGGVWKSSNAGANWQPITDQLPTLNIGDIAIDPSDKNTLYVGTGEPNAGGGSVTYDGKGVFKSNDGGNTWSSIGLEETGGIGRIEVDPTNPDKIFVAAMGHLFGNNPERGVFRSEDGGASWQKTLFINDSTGVIDLAINPSNPDTVFAVSWERIRRPNKRVYGGPGCAIWRSTNGGDTWSKLTTGLPSTNLGRIGISISASQPDVMYAIYADQNGSFKGIYKSNNRGNSWSAVGGNGDPGYPGYGWWFGQIRVHPKHPDEVYALGLDWTVTTDGGQFWSEASPYLHADYHAFYIHPANTDFRVVGNDGGIFISQDGGGNWIAHPIPTVQFYSTEIDFQHPTNLYGGAQDNGTWRTTTGNLDDWEPIFGGDGFITLVNPVDNSIYYGESQYGGFSGTNGASAPQASRYNWNTPYVFDPNNPNVMYFGAESLFKSINGGLDWTSISNDLSNGASGQNGVVYGTITSIAVSPMDDKVIWVGTDDGNVWVSSDNGNTWSKVSGSLPKRWVTRVVADPTDPDIAFVCLSGYRHFENMAHIYRTTDRGQSWQSVSGNMPDIPVNDLIIDPIGPNKVWYIGTDAGVFMTSSAGTVWQPCNQGLPLVPVTDLCMHFPTRTLVAATFGRSMYKTVMPIIFGTHSAPGESEVRVIPNPFNEHFKISFAWQETQSAQLEVFDVSGKRIKTVFNGVIQAGGQNLEISVDGLEPGVYFVKMTGQNGASFCKKVLKI